MTQATNNVIWVVRLLAAFTNAAPVGRVRTQTGAIYWKDAFLSTSRCVPSKKAITGRYLDRSVWSPDEFQWIALKLSFDFAQAIIGSFSEIEKLMQISIHAVPPFVDSTPQNVHRNANWICLDEVDVDVIRPAVPSR
jgi:hypothetical protein